MFLGFVLRRFEVFLGSVLRVLRLCSSENLFFGSVFRKFSPPTAAIKESERGKINFWGVLRFFRVLRKKSQNGDKSDFWCSWVFSCSSEKRVRTAEISQNPVLRVLRKILRTAF